MSFRTFRGSGEQAEVVLEMSEMSIVGLGKCILNYDIISVILYIRHHAMTVL